MRRSLGVALEIAMADEDASAAEFNAAGMRLVDLLNVLHAPPDEHLELVRRASALARAAKRAARSKETTACAIFDILEANHRKELRTWHA